MRYEAGDAEARRQLHARQVRAEREQWREFQEVYRRCRAIAVGEWTAILEAASAQQQALAEAMRDRMAFGWNVGGVQTGGEQREIPVPLFTPRERWQFIKEVTTALMIDARQRGLTAIPEFKEPNGETQSTPAQDRTEAGQADAEAAMLDAQGSRTDAPLALVSDPSDEAVGVPEATEPSVSTVHPRPDVSAGRAVYHDPVDHL